MRQNHLCIACEIRPETRCELEALLASMTEAPGQADPDNPLVPFRRFPQLHFARFVILDDPTLPDREKLGTPWPPDEPTRLAFIANHDGPEDDLLRALADHAGRGLRTVFAHCRDFDESTELFRWMRRHRIRSAAKYANWPGRTAQQVREEDALHRALRAVRLAHPDVTPEELRPLLLEASREVPLTALERPAIAERLRAAAHFALLPLALLLLLPVIVVGAIPFLIILRRLERTDPVHAPVPSRERNRFLSAREDHDITNQYGAIGSLKPGRFRRWLAVVVLWVINWGARHLFRRGRLGRVNTIHFASWTFLDDKRRVYFASNYDGSREAYNDDFINKVAFGLNLSFSSGLGYPRTDWLIFGGARHEQDFKRYLFHHQIPTQVWYKAFPGLSTYDLARNARIRQGLGARLEGAALRRWIAEI